MREIIAGIFLTLAGGLFIGYFIIRPLGAIGDIPIEIKKLRESVDHLAKTIKYRESEGAE